ncbi:MAG: holo-ACP synthase [Betaproteobacteria bacterium]|nr:holo-ACP synthase [Betaproteobacteria bacterium]
MIFGIGSDLVSIQRIRSLLERHGDALAKRILSPEEWPAYEATHHRAQWLAKRFAAKEALAKALGTGLRSPVSLRNISVIHDGLGKPDFKLSPPLAQFVAQQGVRRHHLSLSDEQEMACAMVILEQ